VNLKGIIVTRDDMTVNCVRAQLTNDGTNLVGIKTVRQDTESLLRGGNLKLLPLELAAFT
jgi:hypothetical protein